MITISLHMATVLAASPFGKKPEIFWADRVLCLLQVVFMWIEATEHPEVQGPRRTDLVTRSCVFLIQLNHLLNRLAADLGFASP